MISRVRTALAKKEAGFTLVELLVTVIIIGLLAAIGIPLYLNQQNKAHDAAVKSDITNAALAADTHYTEALKYPTTAAGFANDEGAPLATEGATYVAFVGAQNYVIYGKSRSGALWRYVRNSGEGPKEVGKGALPPAGSVPTADSGAGVSAPGITWGSSS